MRSQSIGLSISIALEKTSFGSSNGHARTGHRDLCISFIFACRCRRFLFNDLFSYLVIICHLEIYEQMTIRDDRNEFFNADIRSEYPRNFRINLILCLAITGIFFNRA